MAQLGDETDPWKAGELRMAVRIDGQTLDPRFVIAGADQLGGDHAIEVDLDKMILLHELEELDVDFDNLSLTEWVTRHVNSFAPRRKGGKSLGPTARFLYLAFIRPTPQEARWLFGLIRKPPLPTPQWVWISTSEVRDSELIVTFVGRALQIR